MPRSLSFALNDALVDINEVKSTRAPSTKIFQGITEIYTKNTHLFIDFGSELNVEEEKSTDKKMVQMINKSKCDAVLFTHYHGDHLGLIEDIPKKTKTEKLLNLR